MTQEERLQAAYDALKRAELIKRGADECAADAAEELERCRFHLAQEIQRTPTVVRTMAHG